MYFKYIFLILYTQNLGRFYLILPGLQVLLDSFKAFGASPSLLLIEMSSDLFANISPAFEGSLFKKFGFAASGPPALEMDDSTLVEEFSLFISSISVASSLSTIGGAIFFITVGLASSDKLSNGVMHIGSLPLEEHVFVAGLDIDPLD